MAWQLDEVESSAAVWWSQILWCRKLFREDTHGSIGGHRQYGSMEYGTVLRYGGGKY